MRWSLLGLVACSHGDAPPAPAPAPVPTRIVETPPIADAAPPDADLHHTLLAREGTLAIAPVAGAVNVELAGDVSITPGAGYRINTELAPALELSPPTAVVVEGIKRATWNRDQLHFTFGIDAREPGDYALHGTLHFAVCKADACFPKDQPVTIPIAITSPPR